MIWPVSITAALALAASVADGATIIQPSAASVTPTHFGAYSPTNTINGSGLSGAAGTGANTATVVSTVTQVAGTSAFNYVSDGVGGGNDYFASLAAPVITFDLGINYDDVDAIFVWNYSQGASGNQPPNNALKSFNLEFFSDAAGTSLIGSVTGLTVDRSLGGTSPSQVAQLREFGTSFDNVRVIKMTLTDNYYGEPNGAGGDRVGLGEVRFSQVPEPSVALLGTLGMIVMLRRRR